MESVREFTGFLPLMEMTMHETLEPRVVKRRRDDVVDPPPDLLRAHQYVRVGPPKDSDADFVFASGGAHVEVNRCRSTCTLSDAHSLRRTIPRSFSQVQLAHLMQQVGPLLLASSGRRNRINPGHSLRWNKKLLRLVLFTQNGRSFMHPVAALRKRGTKFNLNMMEV
jgi:hypothetical protein